MPQKFPSTVFITGGNEGIGYTFCTQLLAKGFHLIVVDVLVMHLEKLQKKFPEKIQIFQLDLCDISVVRALFKKLPIAKIDYVINNAGINNFSWFHQSDLDYNLQMMRLNVEAVVVLTQLFTQAFVKRDHGRILNLSSIASLQPMPMWQVYAGSKVFIRNFSVAVNLELKIKKSQVRVLTLCPPVIRTRMYRKIAQSNSYRDKD